MRNIFYESNCEYNVFKFCYEFAFIFLFSFRKNNKKKKNKIFSIYWWCGNGNYLYFLFITSRALFQRHAEFNKLLLRNFFYMLILLVLQFHGCAKHGRRNIFRIPHILRFFRKHSGGWYNSKTSTRVMLVILLVINLQKQVYH